MGHLAEAYEFNTAEVNYSRHPSWLEDDVLALLDRRGAGLCLHDMNDRAAVDTPGKVKLVYLRRHGGSANAEGGYTDQQIRDDARRVREWLSEGRTVYAYYNNDLGGNAVQDAVRLREAVGD